MTLYSPTSDLPIAALSSLADGAEFTVDKSKRTVTAYHYTWPDLTIDINIFPSSELADHLDGFVAFAQTVADKVGSTLSSAVANRILSTKLVLGFVVTPDYDDESRFERLQDIIGAIAFNTESIVFWEGRILDENAAPLV